MDYGYNMRHPIIIILIKLIQLYIIAIIGMGPHHFIRTQFPVMYYHVMARLVAWP